MLNVINNYNDDGLVYSRNGWPCGCGNGEKWKYVAKSVQHYETSVWEFRKKKKV